MPDSLEYIIRQCQSGKADAQQTLYNRFRDKLFGICLRYSDNRDDAQDVLQDGFIRIFEKIGQFRFEGSFEGWMKRIMVNMALARYRSQCQIIHISDGHKEAEAISDTTDTDDMTEKELLAMVQELSPKYRLVFNLYAIEGYSHKEIAEMLQITEGTSKSNLSRARFILQEKVTRHYAGNTWMTQ